MKSRIRYSMLIGLAFLLTAYMLFALSCSSRESSEKSRSETSSGPSYMPDAAASQTTRQSRKKLEEQAVLRTHEIEREKDIEFRETDKAALTKKFIVDADGNPFYWLALSRYISQAKATQSGYESIEFTSFLKKPWGTVTLRSEPEGAEVLLMIGRDSWKEGQTTVKRRYPEGDYTFKIRKDGYREVWANVFVRENNPVEETIKLQKQ